MKSFIQGSIVALSAFGFFNLPIYAAAPNNPSQQKEFLIFAGQLRNFFDLSEKAAKVENDKEKANEYEQIIGELTATGQRAAQVYFFETPEIIQGKLTEHLKEVLAENTAYKKFFVHLGNGFAKEADRLVQILIAKQKKVKTYSLLGGVAVGAIGAGAFLWFKSANPQAAMSAVGKIGVSVGILAAGSAIGFGVGHVLVARLPVDNSIKNAKDFVMKYRQPAGQNFIDSLTGNKDLKLRMALLNSILESK